METQTNTQPNVNTWEHAWSQTRERVSLAGPLVVGVFGGALAQITYYNDTLNEIAAIDHKIDGANTHQATAEQDITSLKDARQTLRHDDIPVPTEIARRIDQDKITIQQTQAEVKQLTAEKPHVPEISVFMIGGIVLVGIATWGARRGHQAWRNRGTPKPDKA